MQLDLLTRRSVPSRLLGEPGPSPQQLREMLIVASRVPDHGSVVPWRFLRVAPASAPHWANCSPSVRKRAMRISMRRGCARSASRFSYAPEVLIVVGCYQQDHRIPLIEQQHTSACVCFSLLQAAQECGFAAQWLTGWAAYDESVQRYLGLQSHEAIVGFIHIGSAKEALPERPRPALDSLLQEFSV